MAEFLKNFLGGNQPAQSPLAQVDDNDFADVAGIAKPAPPSHAAPSSAASALSQAAEPTKAMLWGEANRYVGRPYTKWYRVWERATLADFQAELFILPFLLVVILVHLWGVRTNKRKARAWAEAHAPILEQEFDLVGVSRKPQESLGALKILREKTASEYISYASGRQNVAFVDFKLTMFKRYNPMARLGENLLSFFFESQPAPNERMEATAFCFDGKEADMVPALVVQAQQAQRAGETYKPEKTNSSYDNFVFAVVHKDQMKRLRDGRYDLSLTVTKDHAKLPEWATVMSESAEITESLLTSELVKAIESAGSDVFEALVITDQPIDQPRKLNEALPRKRVSLSLGFPSSNDYTPSLPLFQAFLRLPDKLASGARFRPEALRRVKATREEEIKKIKRADEDEKSEERRLKAEKEKKEERDKKLSGMSAEEQKKFLDRERALDIRRGQKKRSVKA